VPVYLAAFERTRRAAQRAGNHLFFVHDVWTDGCNVNISQNDDGGVDSRRI